MTALHTHPPAHVDAPPGERMQAACAHAARHLGGDHERSDAPELDLPSVRVPRQGQVDPWKAPRAWVTCALLLAHRPDTVLNLRPRTRRFCTASASRLQ